MLTAEANFSARPLRPELAQALAAVQAQIAGISEQVSMLQASVDSLRQPGKQNRRSCNAGLAESGCQEDSALPGKRQRLWLPMETHAGLSSGLQTVQQAVDEWFVGLYGFPPPSVIRTQAAQQGQRLSKKASDQLSRRRHLPLLAAERGWPMNKAIAVYSLVMERHGLSLAELRDGVRLSNPVRDPAARGGKPASCQVICRSPHLPEVSVEQFAAWVAAATEEIAVSSSPWASSACIGLVGTLLEVAWTWWVLQLLGCNHSNECEQLVYLCVVLVRTCFAPLPNYISGTTSAVCSSWDVMWSCAVSSTSSCPSLPRANSACPVVATLPHCKRNSKSYS